MTIPFWQIKNLSTADSSTDVLIIGGGYAGLSTAFWLTEFNPQLKISVLERAQCGSGASGRNAGFLTKGSASFYKSLYSKWGEEGSRSIYQFAETSIKLLQELILKNSPVEHEQTSSLTLFHKEDFWKEWKNNHFNPAEFNFHWKNAEQIKASIPGEFFGALENDFEFKINPFQLINFLKETLVQRNVSIIENNSAFKLTSEGVLTETSRIKAHKVVLALNGYFPEFDNRFKDHFRPRRAQMLAVEINSPISSNALHYDPPERVYWRKASEKTLLIGGKRLLDEKGEEGNFEKVSDIVQSGLESYLRDQLKTDFKILRRWSGIMGFTENELPYIQSIEAPMDAYIIGGFSGHGMGLGFHSGKEMAELVTGVKKDSFFQSFHKYN